MRESEDVTDEEYGRRECGGTSGEAVPQNDIWSARRNRDVRHVSSTVSERTRHVLFAW